MEDGLEVVLGDAGDDVVVAKLPEANAPGTALEKTTLRRAMLAQKPEFSIWSAIELMVLERVSERMDLATPDLAFSSQMHSNSSRAFSSMMAWTSATIL